jgi:hypothetical protein
MTTVMATPSGGSRCIVGGRFVVTPTFGANDLHAMLASKTACSMTQHGNVLLMEGAANLATVQSHVAQAAKADISRVDMASLHMIERDATRAWLTEAGKKYPGLEIIQKKA